MLRPALVAVLSLLTLAASASAGTSRTLLVPVYAPCPGSGNCFPPKRASTYTFDSITLLSSTQPYTGPGKFAVGVIVKGLKDAGGALVTGRLELRIPPGRVTILTQNVGTIGETSPLSPESVYVVDVKNGAGHPRFKTPDNTPEHGLVVNTFSAPVLYDPEGKPLAATGTQSKP
jgi:hypothetical protein